MANGSELTFAQTNSSLTFAAPTPQTVAFSDSIDGFTDGTSNMVLNGTQPLTIQGTTNTQTIGATNKFKNLQIIGNVTASGGANLINIAGFNILTVTGGSNFTDQGVTSSNIASIIIGDGNGGYLLKPVADFNLNATGIEFGSQDSELGIEGNGTNITVTLNGSLDSRTSGNGNIGLNPGVNGSLTITGPAGSSLGTQGQGGNLLNQIVPSGTGDVTITPDINTVKPLLTGLVGQLILGNVNTGINFAVATNLTVNNVTGTTDFKGQTGALILTDGGSLAAVTNSQAAACTLVTAVNGTITGPISNINEVQVNGVADTTVEFQQDISTVILTLNNGGTADLKGSLTTTNDVEFNNGGGILQFSGTNPAGYSFNSAVTNGQNGTLNAYTNLTSTDASIGTIKTINIGQAAAPTTLTIAVNQPALSLLAAGCAINFNDPSSTLYIQPSQAQTITFNGNLDGTAGGGGILNFDATNGALTLQGATGAETVGATNPLISINLEGANTVTLLGGANQLSFTNGAAALTIGGGTTFADQSVTSASIPSITIGTVAGVGTYELDAVNGNFNLTPGVTFGNQQNLRYE
ncbi:hypothetical protein [Rickettsia endosymbiont of Gonocerus acuteangulatus]|uniref:beta strand repeat-containing protein n=1 Tax=Rickettsia endosymbiont of Gonocerus acuteangulatus TaxID=3066266 RepID=UPI0031329936